MSVVSDVVYDCRGCLCLTSVLYVHLDSGRACCRDTGRNVGDQTYDDECVPSAQLGHSPRMNEDVVGAGCGYTVKTATVERRIGVHSTGERLRPGVSAGGRALFVPAHTHLALLPIDM
jgi:hypothetical protein